MKKLSSKICIGCNSEFQPNRSYKKYCSFDCYANHPNTIGRLRDLVKKQTADKTEKIVCLHCGKENVFKKSRRARYCNRRCYRAYMDERFDRAIVSNYEIDEFQNFDEFLLQDELVCPIRGCNWHGKNLGQHVNFSHGILASDFKKMCGFNSGTGLVTADLSNKIASRPHLDGIFNENRADTVMALEKANAARAEYTSKESKIHRKEAAILRSAKMVRHNRECISCGTKYETINEKQLLCQSCENKNWKKNFEEDKQCSLCGRIFRAKYSQVLRVKKSLPIYCSCSCKNKVNSSKRGK